MRRKLPVGDAHSVLNFDEEAWRILVHYATKPELRNHRLRVYYGDRETGEVAPPSDNDIGYVRIYQENYSQPAQLMFLHNAGALRGHYIMGNILKIWETTDTQDVLYAHPKLVQPTASYHWNDTIQQWSVLFNDRHYTTFDAEDERKAKNLVAYLVGRRNLK